MGLGFREILKTHVAEIILSWLADGLSLMIWFSGL